MKFFLPLDTESPKLVFSLFGGWGGEYYKRDQSECQGMKCLPGQRYSLVPAKEPTDLHC